MAQLSFAFGASLSDPINASLGFTIGWAAPSSAIEDLASKIAAAAAAITATASPPLTVGIPTSSSQVVTTIIITTTPSSPPMDGSTTSAAAAAASAAVTSSPANHITAPPPTGMPFHYPSARPPFTWAMIPELILDVLFTLVVSLLVIASLIIAFVSLIIAIHFLIKGGLYLWRQLQRCWQRRQQQRLTEVALLKEAPAKELKAVGGEGTMVDREETTEDDAMDTPSSSSSSSFISDTWNDAQ
ncbi:hypothetical protein PGQ11_001408 [Apiospora arundinis]|uniref:Uncharacterized protein n=1 Tax=Apiospora arundinis TaxID=335852 RepID=A0ABR2JMU3_9PEZI